LGCRSLFRHDLVGALGRSRIGPSLRFGADAVLGGLTVGPTRARTRVRVGGEDLTLEAGRGCLEAALDLGGLGEHGRLVVDVYAMEQVHPDKHLGWWVFRLGGRRGRATVRLDFAPITPSSVRVWLDGAAVVPEGHWVNPGYAFEPVQHMQLYARNRWGRAVEVAHVRLRVPDFAVRNRYAQHVYATSAYAPPAAPRTFGQAFHAARLDLLGRLFPRFVPAGSRVLDVAGGYSVFAEPALAGRLARIWRYDLVCCDLAVAAMEERARSHPQHGWLVSDALHLPFRDGAFDAVHAGEIVEHVPSADDAFGEWARVLRPGGTLVLSTPNRGGLLNAVEGAAVPLGPDHINELTLEECRVGLARAGLAVVAVRGLYLELLLNWVRPRGWRTVDLLRTRYNRPGFRWLIEALMALGDAWPRRAWNLVYVCRKRSDPV
jgi:SAM-dependent methyltransferase